MAGSMTDYMEDHVMDWIFSSGTGYANLYVGLTTKDPGETGSFADEHTIGDDDYARVKCAPADWHSSSGGMVDNHNAITFKQASGVGWGHVTHFFIADADAAGNMLWYGELTAHKTIDPGDTPSFAATKLSFTLS